MNSNTIPRIPHQSPPHVGEFSSVAWLNIAFGVAICVACGYAIAQTNTAAAYAFRTARLTDRITVLQEQQGALSAERARIVGREPLMQFATARGMVPVSTIQRLVQETGVAVIPNDTLR